MKWPMLIALATLALACAGCAGLPPLEEVGGNRLHRAVFDALHNDTIPGLT
jgi:hypothetical protein